MKKFYLLFVLGCLLNTGLTSQAFEIVYPKSENVVINSETTFFIGNEKNCDKLYINNEEVPLYKTGAFNFPVKLKVGENIFTISNEEQTQTFKIQRNNTSSNYTKDLKETIYPEKKSALVMYDKAPLRSTPYDGGINRLQHFEINIPLSIVGEYGEFYKVQLARDDYAWIKKTDVKLTPFDIKPAKVINFTYSEDENSRTYTIKLDRKTPYILYENDGLDLMVYNLIGYPENKYETHINVDGELFGYKSYYKNDNELVIKVKNKPPVSKTPLKNLIITIDPGHGGSENGAIGCLGEKEKDINLKIALKLEKYLKEKGAEVYLTRGNDVDVVLYDRVAISQNNNSDIFISIHNNAAPDSLAFSHKKGSETYYYYPQSKKLASHIQNALVTELSMADGKIKRESYAVVRNTESPAVLVEIGYIVDPQDNEKLSNEEFQDKAAKAILHGLEKYFNDRK